MVIWIIDHWVELTLLSVVIVVLDRLWSINRNIAAIRAASIENVAATNSVGQNVAAPIVFELTKLKNEISKISDYEYRLLNAIEAIGRSVSDASEVLIYGRESYDRRLEAERKARSAEYARQLEETRESAEAGDVRAQGYYAMHWAMREDYIQAHIWYNIATARATDRQHSLEQRDQIARKMTPEQLAEAERKARDWLDAHPASPTKPSGPDP